MRTSDRVGLTRRAALLPLAATLGGCSFFEDLFSTDKPKLPGTRENVISERRGLTVAADYHPRIAVPPPEANPDWVQPGRVPSHEAGHLALPERIREVWNSNIGQGGGYRQKITAQPVIAAGRVFAMDSDGVVTAFEAASGRRGWRFETQAEEDRSVNVGGGLSTSGDMVFAATGRAEIIALDAARGTLRWRKPLADAARAAPTFAEGRLFVPTLDDQLLAFGADDGRKLWAYQAPVAPTTVLGLPAPAYADGIVVAGFGAGDLVGLRANSGSVAWAESLASKGVSESATAISAVRGAPVIVNGQVYAIGVDPLMIAIDLRSGRRLWERDVGSVESPFAAGDWLFVVSNDQQVAAIARADGRVAWTTQLPRWEDEEKQADPIVWKGPLLAGDRLLLGGSNAQAIAVSPYTGKILGSQPLSAKASVAPVVAAGTVYFVTDDGALIALR